MKNERIILIGMVIVVGVIAFFGGMQYQKMAGGNRTGFGPNGQFGAGRANRQFGNGLSGRGLTAVNGDLIDSSDNSLTVKLPDGSSRIVVLTDKTAYSQNATASKTDLKSGERVMVLGTENNDKSVTAQNVQINPEFRGSGRGSGSGPTGASGSGNLPQ